MALESPPAPAREPAAASSRESEAGAGWRACSGPGSWKADAPVGVRPQSWLRPSTLWQARNDTVARLLHDPTDGARQAWTALARERAERLGQDPDFVMRRATGERTALLVLGDPGEGDDTQWAVVPALESQADGVELTCICSDVVYPSGDLADYGDRFYRPYRRLRTPIVAVPGNHDWYDGLHGFMHNLCGLDAPDVPFTATNLRTRAARALWRRSPRPSDLQLAHAAAPRDTPAQRLDPPQPASYWALDLGPLRLIGIDTGIRGHLDAEQGAWLERVAFADERPKVLLTGRPLIVDGERHPGRIAGGPRTVDDVVRDPRGHFVAAIGGDVHNYQRYPVALPDGRRIQYVVAGGSGAYTHATHRIQPVELEGVTEAEFRCYPLRGDSLARFSMLFDRRLAGGRGRLELAPREAASYLSRLYDLPITRGDAPVRLSPRARLAARLIHPPPTSRGFHRFVSEAFDWNAPPFFKSFLRLDLAADELRIRCFGVTGCASTETTPSVEDEVVIAL